MLSLLFLKFDPWKGILVIWNMLGVNKSKMNEHPLDFSAEHPAELAEICSADHAHHTIKNDVAKVETTLLKGNPEKI